MVDHSMRRWISLVKTLIGIGLLSGLLLWKDNAKHLLDLFSTFKIEYFIALVILELGLNAISSVKWHLFLHDRGVDVSQLRLLGLYLIGKFFNNFLPSTIGGDLARAYILGREINSQSISAASVFLERVTGVVGLALLVGFFSLIHLEIVANPLVSLVVIIAISGCVVGTALFYWPPAKTILLKMVNLIPFVKKLAIKIERLISAIDYFRHRYSLLFLSLIYSISFYFTASVLVYVACLSIGFKPVFLDILVITPVIMLLAIIPVSPNNIGWWEWCFTVLLADAGATAAQGLAVALILRAVALCISLIGGVQLLYQRPTVPTPTQIPRQTSTFVDLNNSRT